MGIAEVLKIRKNSSKIASFKVILLSIENPRIVRGFGIASVMHRTFMKSPPYDTLQLQPASCIERKQGGLLYLNKIYIPIVI